MRKKAFNLLIVLFFTLSIFAGLAYARSEYLNSVNQELPFVTGTKLDDCILCHVTDLERNSYGQDYENALNGSGLDPVAALWNSLWLDSDGDLWDNATEYNSLTFPGDVNDHPETCYDSDFDGFYLDIIGSGSCGPMDCNDSDPSINPAATELCSDNLDNDCDGLVDCQDPDCAPDSACIPCTDNDGDGYAIEGGSCGPIDCNDNDLAVHPGAVEHCFDTIDNDCDGLIDCADGDCSGDSACNAVCVPESSREKGKKCSDGLDNDCDGSIDSADPDCTN